MRVLEAREIGHGILIEHDGYISPLDNKIRVLFLTLICFFSPTSISPFIVDTDAEIRWNISVDKDSIMPVDLAADGMSSPESEFNASESGLLPIVAFMPDGYIEPDNQLELKFEKSPRVYAFSWNYKTASVKMGSYNQ